MKRTGVPRLYRILIPAKNLNRSRRFYESLLSTRGRSVAGGRIYFDCGPVILGVLDYSGVSASKISTPRESLYFATNELEGVFCRARTLGCLDPGLLHDDPSSPLGEIVIRPWGERSFYAHDPAGNPLCFVDERTLFIGTPSQVAALLGSARVRSPGTKKRRRPSKHT